MVSYVDVLADTSWRKHKKYYGCIDCDNEEFKNTINLESKVVRKKIEGYFGQWLSVLDEAIYSLSLLNDFLNFSFTNTKNEGKRPIRGAMMLCSKALHDSCAFKCLIENGLDESARPILRILLEELEVIIILLTRNDLAIEYSDGLEGDEHAFWNKHLSRGRQSKLFEEAIRKIPKKKKGNPSFSFLDALIENRPTLRRNLSGSVHGSIGSAMLGQVTPGFEKPDMFFMTPYNRISAYIPSLIMGICSEIFDFQSVFLGLLINNHVETLTGPDDSIHKEWADKILVMVARFAVFQDVLIYQQKETKRVSKKLGILKFK
jgi:hypothetical protein